MEYCFVLSRLTYDGGVKTATDEGLLEWTFTERNLTSAGIGFLIWPGV
jgi:hypothetical protein